MISENNNFNFNFLKIQKLSDRRGLQKLKQKKVLDALDIFHRENRT